MALDTRLIEVVVRGLRNWDRSYGQLSGQSEQDCEGGECLANALHTLWCAHQILAHASVRRIAVDITKVKITVFGGEVNNKNPAQGNSLCPGRKCMSHKRKQQHRSAPKGRHKPLFGYFLSQSSRGGEEGNIWERSSYREVTFSRWVGNGSVRGAEKNLHLCRVDAFENPLCSMGASRPAYGSHSIRWACMHRTL